MNDRLVCLISTLAFVFSQWPAHAQPLNTPEVHPDCTVTFRLHAPKARNVDVSLMGRKPQAMAKDTNGVWSATLGPLAPELYSYTYYVDGALMIDPQNARVKKWTLLNSLVEVPANPPRLYELLAVPHGTVHQHWYYSKTVKTNRSVFIYTPPDYQPRSTNKYPVLVLLHGYGEDESAWIEVGRAHLIMDNLLAQARVRPMILVMPNGHPVPDAEYRTWDAYCARNGALLETEILDEILPMVQERYGALEGSQSRAIAGLSLGGGQALDMGLLHPGRFGWVGAFSFAASKDGELSTSYLDNTYGTPMAGSTGKLRLLWIGCGRDDHSLPQNDAFVAWLEERKTPHVYQRTAGRHDWDNWRNYLAEFLPLLFKSPRES